MNNKTSWKIVIISLDFIAVLTFIVGIAAFMIWEYPKNLLSLAYLLLPLLYFLLERKKMLKSLQDRNYCYSYNMTGLEFPNIILDIIFGFCVFGKIAKGFILLFTGSTFDSILNFHTAIIFLLLLFFRISLRSRNKNNSEISER